MTKFESIQRNVRYIGGTKVIRIRANYLNSRDFPRSINPELLLVELGVESYAASYF